MSVAEEVSRTAPYLYCSSGRRRELHMRFRFKPAKNGAQAVDE